MPAKHDPHSLRSSQEYNPPARNAGPGCRRDGVGDSTSGGRPFLAGRRNPRLGAVPWRLPAPSPRYPPGDPDSSSCGGRRSGIRFAGRSGWRGCWNGAPPGRCGATAAAGPPPGTRPGDAGPLPQVLGWNYQIAQLAVIDHQGQHGHSRQGPRFSGHRPPRRFQLRHQGAVETGLPEHPQIALFPPFAQVVPAVLDGHYPSDVGLYHPANFKLQGHSPLTRLAESKQRSGVLRIVTEIQTKNLLLSRQIRAIAAA